MGKLYHLIEPQAYVHLGKGRFFLHLLTQENIYYINQNERPYGVHVSACDTECYRFP